MESEKMNCPYCKCEIKKGNGWHVRKCMINFIENQLDIKEITKLYNEEEKSCVQLAKIYNLPYQQIVSILKYIGVPLRNIKEACLAKDRKKVYKDTMLNKYGTTHNFNKDSESRKKWETRLKNEEGIINVFQRKEVKDKIYATMLKKYGIDGIKYNRSKGSYLSYYIEKYGESEGVERYNKLCKEKGKVNKLEYYVDLYGSEEGIKKYNDKLRKISKCFVHNNNLNKKCANILNELCINYESEFVIKIDDRKYYRYDFKIGNLIIELNGVYWHCSPKKYKPYDLVKFPNNNFILAKDKWEQDLQKTNKAINEGFDVVTIWEDEFSKEKLISILKEYNYGSC